MEIFIFLILISLSAFFAASETAIFSLNKFKIHALVRQNKKGASQLAKLKANPNKLLATLTISSNLVQILAASLATYLATRAFGSIGIGIATGVITILVTVFGENLPKSLAVHNSASIALFSAPILDLLGRVSAPVVLVLENTSLFFIRFFGGGTIEGMSEEELKAVIAVSEADQSSPLPEKN